MRYARGEVCAFLPPVYNQLMNNKVLVSKPIRGSR